ncbi:MAG TPA: MFS transporter [Ktedonobacteraceae bacterium]|jgi:MFS family permease
MKRSQTSLKRTRGVRPALWRNRNFLLLWGGQAISTCGTNISLLALPLLALALTHSPALAGLLVAARQLPYLLFSLPAGALVDRWNRKKVMISCDIVRWIASGSVPLAYALGQVSALQLLLVALIEGTAYVLFSLAQISALPLLVEPAHLPRAYALDTIAEYMGTLLGPALSAFIIGLAPDTTAGAILAYLVDSCSYLVSIVTLLCVRSAFQQERLANGAPQKLLHEIARGLRFLWGQPDLRSLAALTAFSNFLQAPVDLALIVLAQSGLHLSVQSIGLILSAGGVGGVLGGVCAPWLHERLRCGQILLLACAVSIGAALLLACTLWPPLLFPGRLLFNLTWPAYGVAVVSYRLQLTPDELQGRVNSAFRNVSYGSEPAGSALGGLLLVSLGARAVFGLMAVGFLACICFTLRTGLRRT